MLVSKSRIRALLGATAISMSFAGVLAIACAPAAAEARQVRSFDTVSYTHLTLPTICSV